MKSTKHLFLTLERDDTNLTKWYSNAAYAVHKDFKSHTGEMMTLRTEALETVFSEQKLNVKSSTEAESVRADDTSSDAF